MGILKTPTSSVIAGLLASATLHAGELRVDINRDSNNTAIVTETGFTRWSGDSTNGAATGTNPISCSFTSAGNEAVTITFAQTPPSATAGGTGLLSNWYKAGAEGAAKLVSDGLTVAPANLSAGGQILMTLTGLNAGPHTLLSYHNAWDNLTAGSLGPIDIHLNGVLAVDNLQPSIRAANSSAAASAYLEFTVTSPADVTVILFAAETDTAAGVTIRNAMINGFEIDTPNAIRVARSPTPADADEHFNADAGSVTLSWLPALAGDTASHDVYFGNDRAAVKAATRNSPLFLGNQTTGSRAVPVGDKHASYFWRVDEIDTLGNVTAGPVWYFRPRQLAFPGAEGHGRFARGGRGGRVVHVTSLADYGTSDTPVPGTLRHAIEIETGPRVIVFDVSGLITVQRRLTLSSPYVTIAGQTAPGKGICLRGWPLGLSGANDAIVRFIRNRPGDISGQTIDGGGLAGCNHSIMDHCSISWSIDEGFSSRGAKNITLQNTLISEALAIAGHSNYPAGTDHGYAATVGGDIASLHHNLLAHCSGRNWSLGGGLDSSNNFSGRLDIRNNVVYNWRSRTTDGGAMEVNFVNNYYKPGPATTFVPFALTMNHEDNFSGSQRCHFAGNVMQGHFNEANQTAGRRSVVSNGVPAPAYETFVAAPFFDHHVATQSANGAVKRVLSDVGANRPLDGHDTRVIQETLGGTHTYTGTGPYGGYPGLPNSQNDVGGWEDYPADTHATDWDSDGDGLPGWWELIHGTNPESPPGDITDASSDPDNDGFTRLCDYLAWLALPRLETSSGAFVEFDLSALTTGYISSPVRQVQMAPAFAGKGSVQLSGDGKTVRFTAAAGFSGIAGFTHTVTDAAGDAMTGEVGVRVVAAQAPPPEPVPPLFINLGTNQVAAVSAPTAAATVNLTAPGSAWTFSAAATAQGTTWNQILRPNPLVGTHANSTTGLFVSNSANQIALTSATGAPTTARLTVTFDIQDLDTNTTRTEPNAASGGSTSLGPSALMGQAWRIYRGGNSTHHRVTGLPPGSPCHIYFYGSTVAADQGCRFILDPANAPDAASPTFVETRGGNSGNVFTNSNGAISPIPPATPETPSAVGGNHTWGRLRAVVDGTGALGFRTAKNAANGQYFNGYQIVPLPPAIQAPPASAVVPLGAPHNLTVQAVPGSASSGFLAYLWRKNGMALTDGSNLSGTSADTLRFTSFGPGDSGFYSVKVTDSNGSTHSDPVYVGLGELNSIIRFPAPNSIGVNRDTPLRVTFAGGRAAVGTSGRIRVFRASDHALVESIDLSAAATLTQSSITDSSSVTYRYLPRSLGGNTYKYLPVTVAGETATIAFSSASLLAYGGTYYVKMDQGAIVNAATGIPHPEINDDSTWRFTIKPAGPPPAAIVYRVSSDGTADFTTIQGAVEHVPTTNNKRITIRIAPGDYQEYVVLKNRPRVTLSGGGITPAETRIAYLVNNNVYNLAPASSHLGARGVFCLDGSPDFVMDNLTVQNLTAKGGSQAEAVVTRPGSPRCIFNNLRLLSFQDTNLIADVFVKDSYVEGDVDFMWGGGTVFYQNCELRAMNNGYYAQYRTSGAGIHGGIYVNCRFTAKSGLGANTQVLNRINPVDYPHAQMVLIDCAVGPHVKANPWQLDGGATAAPTLRVWEYQSTDLAGNLLNVSGRPTFNAMATGVGASMVMPNQQIDQPTAAFLRVPSNIFGGWIPVVPPPPSAYDEFSAIHGLDPATTGAPTADPEHDGLVNALEFLLGGDPLAIDAHGVGPTAAMDSQGSLVFTYRRQTAADGLITDTVETTDNLATWAAAIHGVAGVTVEVIPLDTQSEQVTVRFQPSPNRRFARLRVTSTA